MNASDIPPHISQQWHAMARRPLPRNAEAVLRGENDPKDPLVVSFVGDTCLAGIHVFVDSGRRYDWRFAFDLQALIVVRPGVDARLTMGDIFQATQPYPSLVDFDRKFVASIVENGAGLKLWPRRQGSEPWRALFD